MNSLLQSLKASSRFPPNRLGLIVLPVAVVSLILIVVFLWWPVAKVNDELVFKVKSVRAELLSMVKLNELSYEYTQSDKETKKIEDKLDKAIQLSEFVGEINRLAKNNNIEIINESRTNGKPRLGYNPILQELDIEASYKAIRKFIFKLHTLPTWTLVQDINILRQKNTRKLKVKLILITFSKNQEVR